MFSISYNGLHLVSILVCKLVPKWLRERKNAESAIVLTTNKVTPINNGFNKNI